jgi:hypothetical protein
LAEARASTFSLCPECFRLIPAERYILNGEVYLKKTCPVHGSYEVLIWSDAKLYEKALPLLKKPGIPFKKPATQKSLGCPFDCGLCPEHQQHTCLAILDVTNTCNLNCPVCFAETGDNGYFLTASQVKNAVKSLLEHEGRSTPIQLSGGEPTLHRGLDELIYIIRREGFRHIEVDTNGVRIAENPNLTERYVEAGLEAIYLQFDGVTDDVYLRLRGVPLLSVKKKAIENAKKAGLKIVLAVTVVKGVNDDQLWDIVSFAIKEKLTGVNFQTFARQGRYPGSLRKPDLKLNNPDIARLVSEGSKGILRKEDFLPIPCPHPLCQMLCYLAISEKWIMPLTEFFDANRLSDYYYSLTDEKKMSETYKLIKESVESSCLPLAMCSCMMNEEYAETVEADKRGINLFPIGIHSMMDAWDCDIERLRRCCIHELTPEGFLIPFCLYNMTTSNGVSLYRGKIYQKYGGRLKNLASSTHQVNSSIP